MKKILISFCFILSYGLSYAQINIWQCRTPEECVILGDSLLKNAQREFVFTKASTPLYRPKSHVLSYCEKQPSTNPIEMHLIYKLYMVGEDKAMEIKGTPLYQLRTIRGKFLDLFPIWKKYINPGANMKLLAKEKEETIRRGDNENYVRFTFAEDANDPDYWTIQNTL